MSKKTILCFAGSARKQSLNKQLAKQAAGIAQVAGADGQFIDLADYAMPLYHGDEETGLGLPEHAKTLKAMFTAADGLFIVSPEYNSSFSPLLKNTIDWLSRSHMENETGLSAYHGKIAGLAAVSPGRLGGLRGLPSLRILLSNLGVTVAPHQTAVGSAYDKINEQGEFTDEAALTGIEKTIRSMIHLMA
ncbi:MAG: NAD(P)H-dependent oxidoreductase [Granulosicoccaceae bacterium]